MPIWFFILAVLMSPLVFGLIIRIRSELWYRAYQKVQLGIGKTDLQNVYGQPDVALNVAECSCLYFQGIGMSAQKVVPPHDVPKTLKELPDFYDSLQVLLDNKDRVIAYAWIGEGGGTITTAGTAGQRTGIQHLPEETLVALTARCTERNEP